MGKRRRNPRIDAGLCPFAVSVIAETRITLRISVNHLASARGLP